MNLGGKTSLYKLWLEQSLDTYTSFSNKNQWAILDNI